jgi:hypothetical protein
MRLREDSRTPSGPPAGLVSCLRAFLSTGPLSALFFLPFRFFRTHPYPPPWSEEYLVNLLSSVTTAEVPGGESCLTR